MPRIGGTRFSGHSNVCHGRGEEDPDSKPTIHQLKIEVPTPELDKRVDSVGTEPNCSLKQTVPHIRRQDYHAMFEIYDYRAFQI